MHNPIPAPHRYAIKLIIVGFALGAAFQLGIGLTSLISPRVEVIEIHTKPAAAKSAVERLRF